jgi:hypothetical protein
MENPSPLELLKSVSLADVEKRIAELREEESSLVVLARSLRARELSRERMARRRSPGEAVAPCK